LKIPQGFPLRLRPPEKTGEFLAVDVKAETEPIPAEKATENLIETCGGPGNPAQPGRGSSWGSPCAILLAKLIGGRAFVFSSLQPTSQESIKPDDRVAAALHLG
jgi:hypothetical protein